MTEHRLGLLPAQQDARSFKLDGFLSVPQVKIPVTNERTLGKGTAWGMLGNDRYGDCAFAGKAHAEMAWHHASHNPVTIHDQDVLTDYFDYTGGSDTGTDMNVMLSDWRKKGAYGADPIHAYLQLDQRDVRHAPRVAHYVFGVAFCCWALPIAVQNLDGAWPVPPANWQNLTTWRPWSWGGHLTVTNGYDAHGTRQVTWGRADWHVPDEFAAAYMTNCYAVISPSWLRGTGRDMHGFDLAKLDAQLSTL